DLAVSSPLIDDEGGDGFLDPGESGDFSFIVTNSGAPTSDLTVDIATDDADLTIIDGSSAVPGVAFNGQYDLCADPFEIENALGTGSRWVDFTVEITETSSGTTLAALDLSVPIGTPEILLVDDDEGGIAEINHQTALNAIRYVYRTVEYTSAGELPDLADYAAVIWACGAALTNTITQDDYDLIGDYLQNSGGSLILSGRGVVPDLDQQGFLGLFDAFYTGTTSALVLDGFDPIVQGMMFSITGDGANQDVMDIPTQQGVDFLLNYVGTDGSAAVMCYSDYKAVIFGFGFEDITANSPVFNEPYELMAAILDWFGVVPVVEDDPHAPLPADFRVTGVYPNPFNPTTTIRFDLPVASVVKLDIFDITGRNVVGAKHASPWSGSGTTPTTEFYLPGSHAITFDGSGLASGIYFYRMEAGEFISTGKMVLLK
ncbi:T9SS type A sorting domain-containing protein, partial [bacterium]|nr:T9SS type A sorting domain-containing protein [bacterium]